MKGLAWIHLLGILFAGCHSPGGRSLDLVLDSTALRHQGQAIHAVVVDSLDHQLAFAGEPPDSATLAGLWSDTGSPAQVRLEMDPSIPAWILFDLGRSMPWTHSLPWMLVLAGKGSMQVSVRMDGADSVSARLFLVRDTLYGEGMGPGGGRAMRISWRQSDSVLEQTLSHWIPPQCGSVELQVKGSLLAGDLVRLARWAGGGAREVHLRKALGTHDPALRHRVLSQSGWSGGRDTASDRRGLMGMERLNFDAIDFRWAWRDAPLGVLARLPAHLTDSVEVVPPLFESEDPPSVEDYPLGPGLLLRQLDDRSCCSKVHSVWWALYREGRREGEVVHFDGGLHGNLELTNLRMESGRSSGDSLVLRLWGELFPNGRWALKGLRLGLVERGNGYELRTVENSFSWFSGGDISLEEWNNGRWRKRERRDFRESRWEPCGWISPPLDEREASWDRNLRTTRCLLRGGKVDTTYRALGARSFVETQPILDR